jgi:hypothetical protein
MTIKGSDRSNYFIKIVDAATSQPVVTGFVYGGNSIDFDVPLGSYYLKYASGVRWCDEYALFGRETFTAVANDIFTFDQRFTADGYSIDRWVVELIPKRGGNLRTHSIPRNAF